MQRHLLPDPATANATAASCGPYRPKKGDALPTSTIVVIAISGGIIGLLLVLIYLCYWARWCCFRPDPEYVQLMGTTKRSYSTA